MSNYIKYYLRSAFYNVAILFTSVSVIQIFLAHLGVDSIPLGIFTSLLSVVNVLTNIVFSPFADRFHPVKGYMALLCLPMGVCLFLLIPMCFAAELSVNTVFFLTAGICLLQMFFIALYGVFAFKLPYSIIDIRDFGRFSSIDGIIIGIATTLASFVLTEFLGRYDYFTVMAVGFGIGGGCMLVAALLNAALDTSRDKTQTVVQQSVRQTDAKQGMLDNLGKILHMASFRKLILPNFLRGVHMGMLSVVAVIAIACGNSTETASRVVTVTFLGSILGSVVYMVASRHMESRRLCLLGSIITCAGVLLPFCKDTLFLAVYFVTIMGKYMIDYAVPSQVYAMIPADIACLYQTWRMVITTSGNVLAAAVSGVFIEHISVTGFLVIATVCQGISGVCYYRIKRDNAQNFFIKNGKAYIQMGLFVV